MLKIKQLRDDDSLHSFTHEGKTSRFVAIFNVDQINIDNKGQSIFCITSEDGKSHNCDLEKLKEHVMNYGNEYYL